MTPRANPFDRMLAAAELHTRFFEHLQHASRETFLHHYTKLATALEHVLARQELRLGRFRDTNDPREYKTFNVRLAGRDLGRDVYEHVIRLGAEMLKDTWSLACLTMDNPSASEPVNTWDRGWARSRMWAQYGDNHGGVCLVFDREDMVREVIDQLDTEGDAEHGPVTYKNSAALNAFVIDANRVDPANPLIAVINQMWAHPEELFLLKARDWETEYEYRFLLRRQEPSPFSATVRSSLRGVVLGDAVSEAHRPSIDALCERLEIGAARIVWNNGTPGLRDMGGL